MAGMPPPERSIGEKAPAESVEEANKRLKVSAKRDTKSWRECPYLSTIDRSRLRFDNEVKCSVTLKTHNVMVCLVCGHMFQGRGPQSPAYQHATVSEHHIFMDTLTGQMWCLPELYEVVDETLDDIRFNLSPSYTAEDVEKLLTAGRKVRPVGGHFYDAGYVGLNVIKHAQYITAVLHALLRLPALVRHYLRPFAYDKETRRTPLRDHFAEVFRRAWNPRAFTQTVAPRSFVDHLLLDKGVSWKFKGTDRVDTQRFLQVLLAALHEAERKASKKAKGKPTVIEEAFRGRLRVTKNEYTVTAQRGPDSKVLEGSAVTDVPFFTLPVYLPDDEAAGDVGQQQLTQLLRRYDGATEHLTFDDSNKKAFGQTYQIMSLPQHLVLFFDRLTVQEFAGRKRVHRKMCSVDSDTLLDLSPYVTPEERARFDTCKYELLSSVLHEETGGDGIFKAHVYNQLTHEWLECEDERVQAFETGNVQRVSVSEAYIQIWRRCGSELSSAERVAQAADVD